MTSLHRIKRSPGKAGVVPLPFHAQVREALRAHIIDGSYLPDQQLPSEHEMTALFAVSRITVRQALADLQNEGLIYRVHGKGTYVSRARATQDLTRLQSFGEAMRPLGYETLSKLISVREIPPPPAVGERLGIRAGAQVCEIRRLRYLNREPVSLDVSYFALELGRRLAKEDLAATDIFVILERDFAIQLGHADIVIGARLADESQARLLGLTTGAAMLFIDRIAMNPDSVPIVCEHLFHRGDAYDYHVRVIRDPRPNL